MEAKKVPLLQAMNILEGRWVIDNKQSTWHAGTAYKMIIAT